MIWLTADHHFGHTNIIKYCSRPFKDAEEMGVELVRRWNSVVTRQDIVYYLGDFCFGVFRAAEMISKLAGTKILIRGNHDISTSAALRIGFQSVVTEAELPSGLLLVHNPAIGKQLILGKKYSPLAVVCGHVHNSLPALFPMDLGTHTIPVVNVSVDAWSFYPVSLTTVEYLISRGRLPYEGVAGFAPPDPGSCPADPQTC